MSKYDNASLVQIPSGYKAGTLYSVLPANGDGDFDFTRASIATRVNAEGLIEQVASGVPRLDYPILNGVVQSCPALLLEPARTNLLTYSQAFDNGSWTKSNATITADQDTAPDGNVSADKITISSNFGFISKAPTLASGTQVAYSVFVKNVDVAYINLQIRTSTTSGLATFNFSESVLTDYVLTTGTSADFLDYGNGWYRCTLICTTSEVNQLCRIQLPDSGDSVYIWGAQIEAGSYATSYIPTSGTAVARAAEVCNGAGTSAEFNDSEGVLFAEVAAVSEAVAKRISISDGTTNEVVDLRVGTTLSCAVVVGGTAQATLSYSSAIISDFNKIALKYKTNDFAFWVNGFEVGTDTSGSTPTGLDVMNFDRGTGTLNYYGNTKQLIAFDAALTDEQLEDLTSWDSFEELAASQFYTLY